MLTLGHLTGNTSDIAVADVVVDSRQARAGSVFYALAGAHVDGHAYVAAAFAQGAIAAFVEHPVPGVRLVSLAEAATLRPSDLPVAVQVPNTLAALQQAARRYRADLTLDVVGITGSVGKTTAKEAIAAVLAEGYGVLKSQGNANNEIGLPLTLLSARPEQQVAVLEMGMYAQGEIALLCTLARPRIGVVTNVQPVHLERLGTIERIAQAKAELVEALPADGVAVLNGDDPRVAAMAGRHAGPSVRVGSGEANHVRIADVVQQGLAGISFGLTVSGLDTLGVAPTRRRLRCGLLGAHSAFPAALAVTVGLLKGLHWPQIERGLAQLGAGLRLIPRRGRRETTILDDSYNASPSAVAGALGLLSSLPGRHIAILGDMLELGAAAETSHLEVGAHCARGVDLLITRGELAKSIARGALAAGMSAEAVIAVDDNAGALAALEAWAQPGDVILVKGSRGMAMESIVSAWQQPEERT